MTAVGLGGSQMGTVGGELQLFFKLVVLRLELRSITSVLKAKELLQYTFCFCKFGDPKVVL